MKFSLMILLVSFIGLLPIFAPESFTSPTEQNSINPESTITEITASKAVENGNTNKIKLTRFQYYLLGFILTLIIILFIVLRSDSSPNLKSNLKQELLEELSSRGKMVEHSFVHLKDK